MPMLPYGRKASPILYDVMRMVGGWDLMSPTFELTPGYLRDIQNFEVSAVKGGGYTRIAGYERFDGRPSPSDAAYSILQVTSFVNTPVVGDTVTGQTSGATGVVIAVGSNYLLLTKVTGVFSTGANILNHSQTFDNAAWTKSAMSIVADSIAAPDGTTTADSLLEDGSTGYHTISQSTATVPAGTYTLSIYVKPGVGSRTCSLYAATNGFVDTAFVEFNPHTGVLGTVFSGGSMLNVSASSAVDSNGFYRVQLRFTTIVSDAIFCQFSPPGSYTGDGVSLNYIWGAQCELGGTAGAYQSTLGSGTDTIKVGATTIGLLTTATTTLSALLDAQYTNGAADVYRADIGQVPGSGAVRGVVTLAVAGVDKVYAFRNNAGGTAVDIYVASSSGWTAVPLFYEVSFTAGAVTTPADGATLTQGGVTATVKRVMLQTSAWTGAGTGRLIITAPSGGNFAAGAATLTGGATCTLSGVQTAITILPNGRFDFDVGNFSGQATTIRVYGCDGVNRGFEFDGTTYAPIVTGATIDTPTRVKIHKNHLFYAFGSSVIHSGPAKPFKFASADGASEIAVGDTVTNFLSQPGSQTAASLGISTTNNTIVLYGSSISDWNLVTHNTGVGGITFTAQLMNQNFWLDDPGIVNMYTSQNFGNFEQSTISNRIQDYILTQRSKVACSGLNRLKSQYRLHFNDGSGIYATIVNGRMQGISKVLFPDVMYCAWSGSNTQSNEVSYVGGATSGYVYQLDKGTSCDGANIEAFLVFVWNSMRTPRILKRYRKASVEISSNYYAAFDFGYSLSYQTNELIQPITKTYESGLTGTDYWDSFTWDSFVWDGATLVPAEIEVFGSGVNIQTGISLSSDYIQPFTVNSIIYHYSPRRGVR